MIRRTACLLVTVGMTAPGHAVPCDPAGLPVDTSAPADEQIYPRAVSDGMGGAIVAYVSDAGGAPLRRVNAPCAAPVPDWPEEANLTTAGLQQFGIVPDGSGGLFASLMVFPYDISVQHFLANGERAAGWPAAGVPVCVGNGLQFDPAVAADGFGGVFVTWWDRRSGTPNTEIYLQRVLASGEIAPGWPVNGLSLTPNAGTAHYWPQVIADGQGGAIVFWRGTGSHAIRVNANGQVVQWWPITYAGHAREFVIQPDGESGAWVAWIEALVVEGQHRIRLQHIRANGTFEWPASGAPVCLLPSPKAKLRMYHDEDGFTVSWLDARDSAFRVYVQRLSDAAVPQWTTDGVRVGSQAQDYWPLEAIPDGAGGVYMTWADNRDDAYGQVYAQHLDAAGGVAPGWPSGSVRMTSEGTVQDFVSLVATADGGGLLFFHDSRENLYRVYSQGLGDETPTDSDRLVPVRHLVLHPNTPNPFNPTTRIRYELPRSSSVVLRVLDVAGHVVRDLVPGDVQDAGPHSVLWDGRDGFGREVSSGVYVYRLSAGSETAVRRMVLIR